MPRLKKPFAGEAADVISLVEARVDEGQTLDYSAAPSLGGA